MKIGAAALAAILAATPALATTDDNPFSADSVVLDLRGINLASVEGQQRLAGMSSIHLALGAQTRACHADVVADIRSRITAATAAADTAKQTRLALR